MPTGIPRTRRSETDPATDFCRELCAQSQRGARVVPLQAANRCAQPWSAVDGAGRWEGRQHAPVTLSAGAYLAEDHPDRAAPLHDHQLRFGPHRRHLARTAAPSLRHQSHRIVQRTGAGTVRQRPPRRTRHIIELASLAGLGTLASLLAPDVRAYRRLREITKQLSELRRGGRTTLPKPRAVLASRRR
jgi:hypothetical protein